MSEWSVWSTCSKKCDSGSQKRTRKIITNPKDGGKKCPVNKEESRECNSNPCPGMYLALFKVHRAKIVIQVFIILL